MHDIHRYNDTIDIYDEKLHVFFVDDRMISSISLENSLAVHVTNVLFVGCISFESIREQWTTGTEKKFAEFNNFFNFH